MHHPNEPFRTEYGSRKIRICALIWSQVWRRIIGSVGPSEQNRATQPAADCTLKDNAAKGSREQSLCEKPEQNCYVPCPWYQSQVVEARPLRECDHPSLILVKMLDVKYERRSGRKTRQRNLLDDELAVSSQGGRHVVPQRLVTPSRAKPGHA